MLPHTVYLYTSDTCEPFDGMGDVLISTERMPGRAVMSAFDRVPLLWLMMFEEKDLFTKHHAKRSQGSDIDLLDTQIGMLTDKSVAIDNLIKKTEFLSELLSHDISLVVQHLSQYLEQSTGKYVVLDTCYLAAVLKESLRWWAAELLYATAYLARNNPITKEICLDQETPLAEHIQERPISFCLGDWLIDDQISAFRNRRSISDGFVLLGGDIELLGHGYGEWFSPVDHPEQLLKSPADLRPFLKLSYSLFIKAVREIISGQKSTHWSWYIFPQLLGLSKSATSQRYAIKNLEHASMFLQNKVLSDRLSMSTMAMLGHEDKSAVDILGVVDASKFHACMTLFDQVEPNSLYMAALRVFFQQRPHEQTLELLKGQ